VNVNLPPRVRRNPKPDARPIKPESTEDQSVTAVLQNRPFLLLWLAQLATTAAQESITPILFLMGAGMPFIFVSLTKGIISSNPPISGFKRTALKSSASFFA